MAGAEPLTELHFFGIPTAYYDIFPKGVPVVIRSVPATAEFCFLYPNVSHLSLVRIGDSEFQLIVTPEARVTDVAVHDLSVLLVQMGVGTFPVSIVQVTESQAATQHETPVTSSGTQNIETQTTNSETRQTPPSQLVIAEFETVIEE